MNALTLLRVNTAGEGFGTSDVKFQIEDGLCQSCLLS